MLRPPSMFGDAPQPVEPPSFLSSYIQPNFGHGLRIWWAFFWPTTLIAAVLTVAINFGMKVIYEHTNFSGSLIRYILKFSPYLITYAVALFIMEYVFRKNFRHFRLGLLSNRGGDGAKVLTPTFGRTLRVWWTYSWRTFVYRLIIMVAATIPLSVVLGVFTRLPLLQAFIQILIPILIDGAAGLFVIYSNILDEDFGDFRVCLLPREKDSLASAAAAATTAATP